VVADNYESTLGINSRSQLAVAERILRRRKVEELMADGVTIMDPHTTFIDAEVHVGMDTVIYPFTFLEGVTVIGEDCCIGPHVRFQNTVVGDGVKAHYVYAHDADVESGTDLGQFNHIRPDSHLGAGVKLGNFVEVKNSDIGAGSKLPHLSYIGDCDMGEHVNMGCGTITVNYDGRNKFRTVIGDNAFVGCNSNLVAPVALGEDSYVAAGSTITRDVPAGTLAVARILAGKQEKLSLGNLDAKRDWGFAGDYVEGMWRMLQQETPDDYVLATNETHTVREFAELSFREAGIEIAWRGSGVEEKGYDAQSGRLLVDVDPRYFRPAEVELLWGDASKAERELGWQRKVSFADLVRMMIRADMEQYGR